MKWVGIAQLVLSSVVRVLLFWKKKPPAESPGPKTRPASKARLPKEV